MCSTTRNSPEISLSNGATFAKKGGPKAAPSPAHLETRAAGGCDGFLSPGRRGYNSAVVSQWPSALSLSTIQLPLSENVNARANKKAGEAALRLRRAQATVSARG